MPADRYNTTNINRPLMPALATNRTAKSPVTPRLAASAIPSTTPISRRSERSDASTTPRGGPREDLSTPVKSFLSSNVTPRSSSRKSRAGSTTPSGTPTGTPLSPRPASTLDISSKEQGAGFNGLAVHSVQMGAGSSKPKGVVNGGASFHTVPVFRPPSSTGPASSLSEPRTRENASMFFHASDAQSVHSDAGPKRSPTFFYANGKEEPTSARSASIPSPPLSAVERSRPHSKFFFADEANAPLLTPPLVTKSPESFPFHSHPAHAGPALRPPSPSKDNIHLSYRKGASQVIRPTHHRPSLVSILPGQPSISPSSAKNLEYDIARRRSSAESARSKLSHHRKSASVSSLDTVSSGKKSFNLHADALIPSPLHLDSAISTDEPLTNLSDSTLAQPGDLQPDALNLPLSVPQSPTKLTQGQTPLQQMNELAANARRERKVLDLEISNSSLLAINRQLEREVRKQKAELRRFRRLSRAGRFSTGTFSSVGDISSYADSELGELSDMLEEDEEERQQHDYDTSDDSSTDEGTLSPNALAERDAKHRFKDEQRLQLDLSKHRELLVDSQKMNQSLKRCLGLTEELINEGKKALQYRVHVSDVQLGGRVLTVEEQFNPDTTAESAAVGNGGTLLGAWSPPVRVERGSLESQLTDKDSGVELEGSRKDQHDLADLNAGRISDIIGETF